MRLLTVTLTTVFVLGLFESGCKVQPNLNSAETQSIAQKPSPSKRENVTQLTLPILDALLANDAFVVELKSKLSVTDEQVSSLKRVAGEDVARLRDTNAEENSGDAADARSRASDQIGSIIGNDKIPQLDDLVRDFWAKGAEEVGGTAGKEAAAELSKTPNAVPNDTRIVVNIPAFRMDLFRNGSLVKSYKIGIGYPEFPLPQGLREAKTIIFNPTWTPPDSPWVAKMKNVTAGQKIEAGSELNPLGPIKIPIGLPSLIHGGKSPAKLGHFASHGCVGLTTAQVKDFARLLSQAAGNEVSEKTMATYLADKYQTKVVKLREAIPVELRYETIVLEDGKLHIFKDVYDQNTNTEENLRAVLEANGVRFEDLSQDEKAKMSEALNEMSAHPKKVSSESNSSLKSNDNSNLNQNRVAQGKAKPGTKPKNQGEIVIEVAALSGRGYPAPVGLDTGTGKLAQRTIANVTKPTR